ncbi:MAG: hypothetical protein KGL39_29410 [Patescibacteria group bacterium]|nr:hypothetical protein [Patescibacteria group bacterium]
MLPSLSEFVERALPILLGLLIREGVEVKAANFLGLSRSEGRGRERRRGEDSGESGGEVLDREGEAVEGVVGGGD